jgi:hypothetical protein
LAIVNSPDGPVADLGECRRRKAIGSGDEPVRSRDCRSSRVGCRP